MSMFRRFRRQKNKLKSPHWVAGTGWNHRECLPDHSIALVRFIRRPPAPSPNERCVLAMYFFTLNHSYNHG